MTPELEMLGREKPQCSHGPIDTQIYDPNVKPEDRPKWHYYSAMKTKTNPPHYLQPRACKRCGQAFIFNLDTNELTPVPYDDQGNIVLKVSGKDLESRHDA